MKLEMLTIGAAAIGLLAMAEPTRAMPIAPLAPAASAASDIEAIHYVPCPRAQRRQVYVYPEGSRTRVHRRDVYIHEPSRRGRDVYIDRRGGGRDIYTERRFRGGPEGYRERGRSTYSETYRGGAATGRSISRPEDSRSMDRPGLRRGQEGYRPGREGEQGGRQGRSVDVPRSGRSGAEPSGAGQGGSTTDKGMQKTAPQGTEKPAQGSPRGGSY